MSTLRHFGGLNRAFVFFAFLPVVVARAEMRLPAIFADHMVFSGIHRCMSEEPLQREKRWPLRFTAIRNALSRTSWGDGVSI